VGTIERTFELAKSPSVLYKHASSKTKRELLKTQLSNLVVGETNVQAMLVIRFRLTAERQKNLHISPGWK